jgi:ABC-type sugar transport system permease subunit
MSTFTETASTAEFLLTICALEIIFLELMSIVGRLALVFSNRMEMKEVLCILLVLPWLTTPDVPATIWTPLYFIIWSYKIGVFEYVLADLGWKVHERSWALARSKLL